MLPISRARLHDIVRPYLAIEVAGHTFGLPVNSVHEVVTLSGVSLVLQPPDYRAGFATRQGRTIPVIDVRPEFGGKQPFTTGTRIVIVWARPGQGERMQAGLLVDATGTLLTIGGAEIGASLEWRHHRMADCIDGCSEREGRRIGLLNTDRLIACSLRKYATVGGSTLREHAVAAE